MSINRHALRFQVSLFFLFLVLTINAIFFIQYRLESQQAKQELIQRFHDTMRIFDMGRREHLSFLELKERMGSIKMEIKERGEAFSFSHANLFLQKEDLDIYQDRGYFYFVHKTPHGDEGMVFRYQEQKDKSINITLFALLMNVAVFIFYLYVMKKLKPLEPLKAKIVQFAEGELEVAEPQMGKDEIAEVSNEFNNAISKIKTLQESRNLFLRNIMHELKTPIAKGKLITDLMDDSKNQERLQRIFSRFEYLLGEFSKIEQVTSNTMILDKKRFRMVDILDNAFDILLIDSRDVDIEINANLEIEADYELMSTALKNLIDNALKYGIKRTKIIIEEDSITIESHGKELENNSFETAFNREFEDSSKGLGLGLYITHHIVKKHGFTLNYTHAVGINKFSIHC